MSNDKKKPELELIDLENLPIPTRSVSWPYAEWERDIPPGKAIEITNQLPKGKKASTIQSTIMMNARRRRLTIKAMVRNKRIWVYKEVSEIE